MEHSVDIVIGIPGAWATKLDIATSIAQQSEGFLFAESTILNLTTKESFKLQVTEHRPGLGQAFALAGGGSFSEAELEAIEGHTYILYVFGEGGSIDGARHIMEVATGLVKAGGLAVKIETSAVAHTANDWQELVNQPDKLRTLYYAFVTFIQDGDNLSSCGMHTFGLPEGSVTNVTNPDEAALALETFLLYLLREKPALYNGDIFTEKPDAPGYRLELGASPPYTTGDLFYNPAGVWRLTSVARSQRKR